MSNYTITTDFGAKDSLPSSNDSKVVRGSEFTTEFTSIQTAIATKADTAGDTFTGVVNFSADVAVNTNTLFVDVSEAKVGIGTTSPQAPLHVHGDINLGNNAGADAADVEIASLNFYNRDTSGSAPNNASIIRAYSHSDTGSGGYLTFATSFGGEAEGADATEKMRIDASGNLLVGTTTQFGTDGISLNQSGWFYVRRTSDKAATFRLDGDDGNIITFDKAGSTVGSIGTSGSRPYFSNNVNDGIKIADDYVAPCNQTGADKDASLDLGSSTVRFKDLHLSGTGYFGTNVGIGTTSPSAKLHIDSGATDEVLRLEGTGSPYLSFYDTGVRQSYIGSFGNTLQIHADTPDTNIAFYTEGTHRMRIDSSGNVGIGTDSPAATLSIKGSVNQLDIETSTTGVTLESIDRADHSAQSDLSYYARHGEHKFFNSAYTQAMTIDTSGNVLVGKTDTTGNVAGVDLRATGLVVATVNNNYAGYFNRTNSDGKILDFRKDNLNVGSIGSRGGTALFIESGGTTGTAGLDIDVAIAPRNNGALSDGEIDLGTSAYRFQDLYRSGSTYSTSDRNKKQDIRDLTDAEARVATVAKGSLKAFRYIDSVEAEGDEANIHFGIIAQDLKAAFEAEGLNANDYQVFKTSTYTDDDGVEQTTYSICYENLLAFIIAAI